MSAPTPDQLNLAAAIEVMNKMAETHARMVEAQAQAQAYAMTAEEPLTPLQKLLAAWGIK